MNTFGITPPLSSLVLARCAFSSVAAWSPATDSYCGTRQNTSCNLILIKRFKRTYSVVGGLLATAFDRISDGLMVE